VAVTARQLALVGAKGQALLLETEPAKLAALDEDALLELHDRVRRARTKHAKNYRRRGAAAVRAGGKRGVSPEHLRERSEVFEDALARVSRALAAAARASALALRAERLAAAGTARGGAQTRTSGRAAAGAASKASSASAATTAASPATVGPTGRRKDLRPPAKVAHKATVQAKGARKQAKRDAK
jgi:hypothetical protein